MKVCLHARLVFVGRSSALGFRFRLLPVSRLAQGKCVRFSVRRRGRRLDCFLASLRSGGVERTKQRLSVRRGELYDLGTRYDQVRDGQKLPSCLANVGRLVFLLAQLLIGPQVRRGLEVLFHDRQERSAVYLDGSKRLLVRGQFLRNAKRVAHFGLVGIARVRGPLGEHPLAQLGVARVVRREHFDHAKDREQHVRPGALVTL